MKITEEERLEIKDRLHSDLDKLRLPLLREISKNMLDALALVITKEKLYIIIDNMVITEKMAVKHSTSDVNIIAYREVIELDKNRFLSRSQIKSIRSKFKDYYSLNLPNGFKTIPGYPKYAVNKDGVVIIIRTRLILKPKVDKKGYLSVGLDGKNKLIHRLVLLTFVGYSDLPVDHINNISYDNRITNLEYVTTKENVRRAVATGVKAVLKGEDNGGSKLTKEEVIEIINDKVTSLANLAKKYNVTIHAIWAIKNKVRWKHLSDGIDITTGIHFNNGLDENKIKKIFLSVKSIRELSDEYNVSYDTIKNIKNSRTYDRLTKDLIKPNFKKYSGIEDDVIIDIYFSKFSHKELMEKYNVKLSSIKNIRSKSSLRYKNIIDNYISKNGL